MNWRKNPASNWKLYCIIDKGIVKDRDPAKIASRLFKSGVRVVQIRYKNYPSYKLVRIAKKIQKMAKIQKKVLLINDRIDVALASKSKGVHLGKDDFSARTARRFLGRRSIIGKTVHSVRDAGITRRENIDYVGAGPVFSTPLKKNLNKKGINFLRKVKKRVSVPVMAIGGINQKNIKDVLRAGPSGACVVRAIFQAPRLLKEIKRYDPD